MRRVAVISDVHGNLEALEAVLAAAEQEGCAEIWCLGDVFSAWSLGDVFNAAGAAACLDLVRARCSKLLLGNHEQMVLEASRGHGQQAPSPESPIGRAVAELERRPDLLRLLESLYPSETLSCDGFEVVLAHASPYDPAWHWVRDEAAVELAFDTAPTAQLLVVGHTHVPAFGLRDAGGAARYLTGADALVGGIELGGGSQLLVNPGSIGEPSVEGHASWGILCFDGDDRPSRFEWRSLDTGRTHPPRPVRIS